MEQTNNNNNNKYQPNAFLLNMSWKSLAKVLNLTRINKKLISHICMKKQSFITSTTTLKFPDPVMIQDLLVIANSRIEWAYHHHHHHHKLRNPVFQSIRCKGRHTLIIFLEKINMDSSHTFNLDCHFMVLVRWCKYQRHS